MGHERVPGSPGARRRRQAHDPPGGPRIAASGQAGRRAPDATRLAHATITVTGRAAARPAGTGTIGASRAAPPGRARSRWAAGRPDADATAACTGGAARG